VLRNYRQALDKVGLTSEEIDRRIDDLMGTSMAMRHRRIDDLLGRSMAMRVEPGVSHNTFRIVTITNRSAPGRGLRITTSEANA
jgi:hypothetical protein